MENKKYNFLVDEDKYLRLISYYKCAMMVVENRFKILNEELSAKTDHNPISSIKCRIKSIDSIYDKLGRYGLEDMLESVETGINDVAGVRVVTNFPSDVYILKDYLSRMDDIKIVAVKDYIQKPKPNGYRSLHMIVEVPIYLMDGKKNMHVEIQIRTIAMDFWASLEHQIRYKKDYVISDSVAKELNHCAEMSSALDKRMERLKDMVMEDSGNEN